MTIDTKNLQLQPYGGSYKPSHNSERRMLEPRATLNQK